jgi:hypothetical protein
MYTIVDSRSGLVLFAKYDNEVLDNQVAINQICDIEVNEGEEIFFNFETQKFEVR